MRGGNEAESRAGPRPARTLVATIVVSLVATATFWWGTDGLAAYTAEAARREQVLRDPRPIPAVQLEDQNGHRFALADYRGRRVAVEFIYTRCPGVCRTLGTTFRQIRDAIESERPGDDLALLSVSFDPEHDDRAALKTWSEAHGADGRRWRVVRIADEEALASLLEAFGVVVIPDEFGGYEHNAAIHLLERDGRLARIADIEEPRRFLAELDGLRGAGS